jgi:hypothetical protein
MKTPLLAGVLALAAMPAIAQDVPGEQPRYFLALGAEVNHYAPAGNQAASTISLGARLGETNWWSVSTLNMQPAAATVRQGAGYALVRHPDVLLIGVVDGGVTVETVQVAGAIPAPRSLTLANVGEGVIVNYRLAKFWQRFGKLRLNVGFRMAAVSSQSVQPAFLASIAHPF